MTIQYITKNVQAMEDPPWTINDEAVHEAAPLLGGRVPDAGHAADGAVRGERGLHHERLLVLRAADRVPAGHGGERRGGRGRFGQPLARVSR